MQGCMLVILKKEFDFLKYKTLAMHESFHKRRLGCAIGKQCSYIEKTLW
jgi:hypothetical protein